jgi:hypothetical protein
MESLAEIPQLPPPPSIWAHIRWRCWSLVSQDRRHLLVTLCTDKKEEKISSYIRKLFIVYTLQLLPFEFPYTYMRKFFSLFFISVITSILRHSEI